MELTASPSVDLERGGVNVTSRNAQSGSQGGFALIVAILALMLLTFLGLTLSATTSTELQIATNYRWSQQALYNAEAGLEVARVVLQRVGDNQLVLPEARTIGWNPTGTGTFTPAPPAARFTATRNFEGSGCDRFGNGQGYGAVLTEPNNAANPFQNVSQAFGRQLNGGFTVWVRRETLFSLDTAIDNPVGERLVVTSEGSAPFAGPGTAFTRANRAIRRLESVVTVTEGCRPSYGSRNNGTRGCRAS
jgi:hypothetical protein